ncbi:MAG: VOC family protein [Bacteroidia bacterium]|nr:VOC family protein [Bacteroidia bacterium]
MATINTYLNFNGNCEEAFTFYKSVFGGEFTYVGRYDEMPDSEGFTISDTQKGKIMHIGLPIGSAILMGCDTFDNGMSTFVQGNNFSITINPESKEEANKLFESLSEGGMITMPLEDTFWGAYFGMLIDKFGIAWMVNLESNQAA